MDTLGEPAGQHALQHDRRVELFSTESRKTNAAPQDRSAYFLRACAVDMRIDMSQKVFLNGNALQHGRDLVSTEIHRKDALLPDWGACAQACAVETRMNMSQEPF